MSIISKSIASLINGVSQQVPSQRLTSQLEAQTNCWSDVVEGLGRRRAEVHIAKLLTGSAYSSAFVHSVQRDQFERYTAIITGGDLKVFDLFTGAERPVSFPNGKSYLASSEPKRDFRATKAGDYSFIVNRSVTALMSNAVTPALDASAMVFVRAGSYAASYQLTIDGNTWSVTCPSAAQAAGNGAMEAAVKTNIIAQTLANYLSAGTTDSRYVYSGPAFTLASLGYTVEFEGPLIFIKRTSGVDFVIKANSDRGTDGFRAFKGSTTKLADLPSRGWPAFTIKITGDADIDGGEFWVQYNAADTLVPGGPVVNTTGGWFEVTAPNTRYAFDRATMPHVLTANGDGTFTFRQAQWDERKAGDEESIPVPSFVNKRINHAFFARGRLGLLVGENVVLSRSGGEVFNFWRRKAAQVLDDDPIDYGQTSEEVAVLESAVVFDEDVLIFAPLAQFRLTGADLLTPKTANMKPISKYENDPDVVPISSGKSVFYTNTEGGFAAVYEYGLRASGQGVSADSQNITDHVPNYIPGGVSTIDASASQRILALHSKGSSNTVYVYQHYQRGEERAQAAWHSWPMNSSTQLLSLSIMDSDLLLIKQHSDGVYLSRISFTQRDVDDGSYYPVHLDRRVRKAQCTLAYNALQDVTTVTLPYAHDQYTQGRFIVVERQTKSASTLAPPFVNQMISSTQFVIPGNWTVSTKDFFAGVENPSFAELSEQFMPDRTTDGKAVYLEGRLQLRRLKMLTNKTLGMAAVVAARINDWERGPDQPDIDLLPLNPGDPGYDPDRPGDPRPDDPNDPTDDPSDPEYIDLVDAENRAYEALKTFDSNLVQNDNVSVSWLSPVVQDTTPVNLEMSYQFPVDTALSVAVSVAPNGTANQSFFFDFGAGPVGPFVQQSLLLNASLSGHGGNPDRYTLDVQLKTDNFYPLITDTTPSTAIVNHPIVFIGPNGPVYLNATPPAIPQNPWQGVWVLVRDKQQDDRVVHTQWFRSAFNGTNWTFTNDTTFPKEITSDFFLALRGRVTGVPSSTATTTTWPQDYSQALYSAGGAVSAGPRPITGTVGIGRGKFAYTTDYSVRFYNSSGVWDGVDIPMLIDGTAPSSAAFNYGTPPAGGYMGLRRASTGEMLRFLNADNTEPPTYPNAAAMQALNNATSVTTVSSEYRIFLYAFTDASYYIGSPTFSNQGWWEHYENTSAGPKWGEVWYLPGGNWPVITTEGGTKTANAVYTQLSGLGATVVDQYYVDGPALFNSPLYTGPLKVQVNGVFWDSTYKAQLYVVGDIETYISEAVIGANGIAFFPVSAPGRRKIKIVQISTGKVIAELGEGVGLVRSYKLPEDETPAATFKALKERCFLYDQGVAIIAACIKGDEALAERWTRALLAAQTTSGPDAGNFAFSVNHYSGIAPDLYYRTGATLWCAEALAFFGTKYPSNALTVQAGPNGLKARLQLCLDHVAATYLVTTPGHPQQGLVRGGKGRYENAYEVFNPSYLIPWTALEHNVDAFFAYRRAADVCARPDYATLATTVGTAIVEKMWVTSQGRLAQGVSPGMVPPTVSNPDGIGQDLGGALDLNSWGAMFLVAFNRRDLAVLTMRYLDYFHAESGDVRGYTPYVAGGFASDLYQGTVPGVWSEGTFGVVLARRSIGDHGQAILDYANMAKGLTPEGYLYTTTPDNIFELQNWPNVAGTGWAILAANPQGFWENTMPSLWAQLGVAGLPIDPITGEPGIGTPGTPGGTYTPVTDPFNPSAPITAVTRDGTQVSTYTVRSQGGATSAGRAGSKRTAQFTFPIHKKSTRAVIKFGSTEHLPFNAMSAEWEGDFTGRTQRIG